MTVSFLPYVTNENLNCYNIPDECSNNESFELNVCNTNAEDILKSLGFAVEGEPVAIGVFTQIISNALRKHLNQKSPLCKQVEIIETGKMTMIDMGRREGYIEAQIFELAHRAKDAGATHIGWV